MGVGDVVLEEGPGVGETAGVAEKLGFGEGVGVVEAEGEKVGVGVGKALGVGVLWLMLVRELPKK